MRAAPLSPEAGLAPNLGVRLALKSPLVSLRVIRRSGSPPISDQRFSLSPTISRSITASKRLSCTTASSNAAASLGPVVPWF